MKTLLITFALMAALPTNASAGAPTSSTAVSLTSATGAGSAVYTLTVVFSNVLKRSGKIYIGLANDQASFSGNSYRKTRIEVPATGEVRFQFEGLPAGQYAVRVFQDLNENQKIDRTGQLPTEPFGFSNLPTLMGPPTFSQCAFELTENKNISINLTEL